MEMRCHALQVSEIPLTPAQGLARGWPRATGTVKPRHVRPRKNAPVGQFCQGVVAGDLPFPLQQGSHHVHQMQGATDPRVASAEWPLHAD